MLKKKRALPSYPDGVLGIYKAKDRKTDFGARRNVEKLSDMEPVCTLCYSVQTIREQDYEFAERSDFTLSLKVRTPLLGIVTSEHLALIGTKLYAISHKDNGERDMYLYLEEVRDIDVAG
jgi:hypothetical protein